ncbi:Increased dna methylation [Thalictrum thalictroides]|uniref:Increased dna methylation n=1 Tax=Thalictrum thalictroides TaxID=46969 RepID=A0A7J6UYP8_THATH|nr:Increased dna methylation [Thalictrum thalictroides]
MLLFKRKDDDTDNILSKYLRIRKNKSCSNKLIGEELRKHLLDIGWKTKVHKFRNQSRTDYISSEGKICRSLVDVCTYLLTPQTKDDDDDDVKAHCNQDVEKGLFDSWMKSSKLDSTSNHAAAAGNCSLKIKFKISSPALVKFNEDVPSPRSKVAEKELHSRGRKRSRAELLDDSALEIKPEYCPQAVVKLYELGPKPKSAQELRAKARNHLAAMGWKLWYMAKGNGRELRYSSPNGKTYSSLRTACMGCIKQGLSLGGRPVSPELNTQCKEKLTGSSGLSQSTELDEYGTMEVSNVKEPQKKKRRKPNIVPLTKQDIIASCCSTIEHVFNQDAHSQELKKQRAQAIPKKGVCSDGSHLTHVTRSKKRARQVLAPNPEFYTPRTVLTWLIESNVVQPRTKVYYGSGKDQHKVVQGRITRDGIKCSCCQTVYGISGFQAHAGGTCPRPATNIFLEDGRSLSECQKQMVPDSELKCFTSNRIKTSQFPFKNDRICSVCHYGGDLLLCDKCPSAFHLNCIGLEKLPKGKWFCSSCQCGVCCQTEVKRSVHQFTEMEVIRCDQCEREYHVGCLRERGMLKFVSGSDENWFCSGGCEKVYIGLHSLLGRSIAVGKDNLSWSILKFSKDAYDKDADMETMIEHHNKLSVALEVMHECFEPIKEPHTKDLVKNVLFNRRSTLKRLDFQGFYTVLLEKEEELISVATIRVYGGKVAEVPLVATRLQYRRKGMCRILMNLLESKLAGLGVERLFLPAIPQVLHAWTTSFGFTKITKSERLKYLEYTFLDFQDTTMCHKVLCILLGS